MHQISPKNKPKQALPAPVYLAVYRDLADEVRFVEINQVTYRLVDRLAKETLSGQAVLTQMADDMAYPAERLLAFGLPILKDLHQQQLILGTLR